MRKKIFFFTGIVLLCAAGWALYLYYKPHGSVGNLKPDVEIAAGDLYNQFLQNEAAATERYLNKIVLVNGRVNTVVSTDTTVNILLQQPGDMGGVSCSLFPSKDKGANLEAGVEVSIKGRCTGYLMDVVLADCVLESK